MSTLLGFLVVFRTSQAYNRFWGAAIDVNQMCADWVDAASMTIAFFPTPNGVAGAEVGESKAQEESKRFKHTLVRLFSLLSACALESLMHEENCEDIKTFDTLDLASFDVESVKNLDKCKDRVELVWQWIQ